MATNAKQYTDLSKVDSMEDTDLIAIARKGEQELVTTPAINVAQKAAEIVSSDQVQEVIADLGLGKQVLVQSLNNKGADVQASDTLVQMAAKVDGLDVVGAKEYIIGKGIRYTSRFITLSGSGIEYVPQKDVLITCDTTGVMNVSTFNTDGSIIPLFSLPGNPIGTSISATSFKIGLDKHANHIVVCNTSTKDIAVYSVNWENKSAELLYSHTFTYSSSIGSNLRTMLVSDDGSEVFLFIYNSSYWKCWYYNNTTSSDIEIDHAINTRDITPGYLAYKDDSASKLYFFGSKVCLCSCDVLYNTDSGALESFSDPNTLISMNEFAYCGQSRPIFEYGILLVCGTNNASSTVINSSKYTVRAFSLSTYELLSELEYAGISVGHDTGYSYSIGTDIGLYTKESIKYIITPSGCNASVSQAGILLNVNTRDIKINSAALSCVQLGSDYADSGSYNTYSFVMSCNGSDTEFIITNANMFGHNFTNKYIRTVSLYGEKCYGNIYSRNGNNILQLCAFDQNAYDAGAYDIENKVAVLNIQ